MSNTEQNNTRGVLEDIPLHGSVKYPRDPRVAEYFRASKNGTTPFYEGIAGHFNAANNLKILKDAVNNGVNRATFKFLDPESHTTSKEAASPAEELVGNAEDALKKDAPEEEPLETIPSYEKVTDEDLQNIGSDEDDESAAEVSSLLKSRPTETRKFRDYINPKTLSENPAMMGTHTLMADNLGISPSTSKHKDPSRQMVHELAGLVGEELGAYNENAATKVMEGLNRAFNIFVMTKGVQKNLQHMSAEDILNDFTTYLASDKDLRKVLEYYRKAGNHRHVDEEGKPERKKRGRNDRYVWMGVPHGDAYFSPEALEDMNNLRRSLDDYLAFAQEDPSQEPKPIRVEVLEPSMAADINPVRGAVSGVVVQMNGKKLHHELMRRAQDATTAAQEAAPQEKSAASAGGDLRAEALNFANRKSARNIFTSRGPINRDFKNLLFAWLTDVFINEGSIPSLPANSTFMDEYRRAFVPTNDPRFKADQEQSLSELKKWLDSSSLAPPADLVSKHGFFFNETTSPIFRMASDLADKVDDMAMDAMARGPADIERFTKALSTNLGLFLSNVATKAVPDNLNNWIEGSPFKRTKTVPVVKEKVRGLIADMLDVPAMTVPGESRWLQVVNDFDKNGEHSNITTHLHKWGEYLLSEDVGLEDQGRHFSENPNFYANELVERIIKPSLHNQATEGQIVNYVQKAILDLTGDIKFDVPVIRTSGGNFLPNKSFATTNKQEPYLNVVYLSSEKVPGLRSVNLQAGSSYDLVAGPYTKKDSRVSGTMGKDDGEKKDIKFTGYILEVVDGRRAIDTDEIRLSSDEIPKFLEFAANNYVSSHLEDKERNESAFGGDDEGDHSSMLNNLTSELRDMEIDAGVDPIWEHEFARMLKGKSLEDASKILEKIDAQKEASLAAAMVRQFGSVLEKDDHGGWRVIPSMAQKVLEEHPNSEYKDVTDERRGEIIKSITSSMPSIKDINADNLSPKDLFDQVSQTKEVAANFLNQVLSREVSLPSSKGGGSNPLHGLHYDASFDKALKETLLQYGMSSLLEDAGNAGKLSKAKSGYAWDTISKMVKDANASGFATMRKQYTDAWEKARKSDPATFDSLFVPYHQVKVKSRASLEELRQALEAIGSEGPHLADDPRFDLLMEIVDADGLDRAVVRDVTRPDDSGVSTKVTKDALQNLLDYLSEKYPSDVTQGLEAYGLDDTLLSKNKLESGGSGLYQLRKDASVSKFQEFMQNHRGVGELGQLIDPSGTGGASLGARADKYRIRAPREDAPGKARGTQVGISRKDIHNSLDRMLDNMKDTLNIDPHAAKLLTEGKGISKALAGSMALTRSQRKMGDITGEIKNTLKHSDTVLKGMVKKQQQVAEPNSKDNKADYTQPKYRAQKKAKDLVSWLTRAAGDKLALDLDSQGEVMRLVNKMVDDVGKGHSLTDPYLSQPENIEALKEFAKTKPRRAK